MNAASAPQPVNPPTMLIRTDRSPWADPCPQEIEAALERMSIRINAATAHRYSLHRAAQGVRTISVQLGLLHDRQTADHGRTPTTYLTAVAIEAMQQAVEAVLSAEGDASVEMQRAGLRRALVHGHNALFLLAH